MIPLASTPATATLRRRQVLAAGGFAAHGQRVNCAVCSRSLKVQLIAPGGVTVALHESFAGTALICGDLRPPTLRPLRRSRELAPANVPLVPAARQRDADRAGVAVALTESTSPQTTTWFEP